MIDEQEMESSIHCVIENSEDGFLLVGATDSLNATYNSDIWLIKTDASGNMFWNKKYHGGDENDLAYSVIETGTEDTRWQDTRPMRLKIHG